MLSALGLFALLLGVGFLPLLGGPRYEAGLVAGLIAPLWCSLAGAFEARRRFEALRARPGEAEPVSLFELATAGLVSGAFHATVILLAALVHVLRVGFCEPEVGFVFLLLGACTGTALGGLWGALSAVLGQAALRGRTPRRVLALVWACAWALLLPVSLAVVGLLEFYWTPAVYAFSPLVGFFAGPLYETVNYPLVRLLTYRLGSAFSVVAVLSACFCLTWNGRHWGVRPRSRAVLSLAASACLVSVTLSLSGASLGHRASAQSIATGLGGLVQIGRCELVYARNGTSKANVARLGRDCDAHLTQLGHYFGVTPPARVRVYLFANEHEKARYVGVGHTYVAKPWRREIYLQEAGFPHPALGHELAHIVAGEMGRGPFLVAGAWGGWLPDPGRIEGFAVAAAPREDSDATALEWASALLKLEQLPSLERLFQLGFLGESAAKSYATTGAFVEFVRMTHGPAALRAWYGGATLEEATGQSLAALDQGFRQVLRRVTPAPEVLAEAAQRFSAKAVFQRRCPHLVDRLAEEVEQCCALDPARSLELAQTTLGYDSSRLDLLALQPRCLLISGDSEGAARRAADLLKRPDWAPWQRRALLERSGDAAALREDWARARAFYEQALAQTPSINGQRQLEVRLWALEQEAPVRSGFLKFLAGSGEGAVAAALGLGELGGLERENPMVAYLLGRTYLSQGDAEQALPRLRAAASSTLPLASVQREATRLWLVGAAQLERPDEVRGALDAVLAGHPGAARELEARRVAERVGIRVAERSGI